MPLVVWALLPQPSEYYCRDGYNYCYWYWCYHGRLIATITTITILATVDTAAVTADATAIAVGSKPAAASHRTPGRPGVVRHPHPHSTGPTAAAGVGTPGLSPRPPERPEPGGIFADSTSFLSSDNDY